MAEEIIRLFPGCPAQRAQTIARHASVRGSGRVGRSAAGRALDARTIELAVAAAVRHEDSRYDQLLSQASSATSRALRSEKRSRGCSRTGESRTDPTSQRRDRGGTRNSSLRSDQDHERSPRRSADPSLGSPLWLTTAFAVRPMIGSRLVCDARMWLGSGSGILRRGVAIGAQFAELTLDRVDAAVVALRKPRSAAPPGFSGSSPAATCLCGARGGGRCAGSCARGTSVL